MSLRKRIGLAVCLAVIASRPSAQELSAAGLMAKVGAYAASYGEKSSVVVAEEHSSQNVSVEGAPAAAVRPIELVAEFAIVKVQGGGWTGFRDVIKVNGGCRIAKTAWQRC